MEYNTLKLEVTNNIVVLTTNRPQAMNALSSELFKDINDALTEIESMEGIYALIVTGEGKAFVAGADISEMSDMNSIRGSQYSKFGQDTFNRLSNFKLPVIAAVNGFALGGGCEFALACDIRIASTYARFGQPEVNLGLIPGFCGTQRLPRLIGLSNALYLLMTADMIDASEALRIGLVQKVVAPEELMSEAMALATKIASKGPIAVRKVKEVTMKGMLTDYYSACELESEEFGNLFDNQESHEGMNAFLEKRKPDW